MIIKKENAFVMKCINNLDVFCVKCTLDKINKNQHNLLYAFFVFSQSCNCPRPIGNLIPEELMLYLMIKA